MIWLKFARQAAAAELNSPSGSTSGDLVLVVIVVVHLVDIQVAVALVVEILVVQKVTQPS